MTTVPSAHHVVAEAAVPGKHRVRPVLAVAEMGGALIRMALRTAGSVDENVKMLLSLLALP